MDADSHIRGSAAALLQNRALSEGFSRIEKALPPQLMLPLFAAFFCSGFAALLNQVAWERMLRLFSGSDSVSVTIVVSAFLAGLGLGNWLGGWAADRVSPRRALLLFVGANATVGTYALLSRSIFYDFIFQTLHLASTSAAVVLPVAFIALLVPTLAMGATLPLLARGAVAEVGTAARRVGLLYGIDVVGAATGCLLGTWYIVGTFGLLGATQIAAAASFLAAALALPAASRAARLAPTAPTRLQTRTGGAQLLKWSALFFASGFLAIGLEVIWIRVLSIHFQGTAYTFGHVLFIYLLANAAGLLAAACCIKRFRNHEATAFCLSQFAAVAWAALSLLLVLAWLRQDVISGNSSGLLASFFSFRVFHSFAEFYAAPWHYLLHMAGLPLFLIGPSAFLIGFSFPLVQQAVQRDLALVGQRVGLLLTANIAGNALGGIVTGLLLLPWIGTPATLQFFLALAAGFCIAGFAASRPAGLRVAFAAGIPLALALGFIMPGMSTFWMLLTGFASQGWQTTVVREDRMSVTTLLDNGELVYVAHGGKIEAEFPFLRIHMDLGVIGSLYHPDPRRILNVGFGSGGTSYAAGLRPLTQRVVVYEIIPSIYSAYGELLEIAPERFAPVGDMIAAKDSRYSLRTGDGRAFLATTDERFDVIQADALRAENSGSAFVNSREYFELARSRLAPGGLLVQWAGGPRVGATLRTVFPHGVVLGQGIVIASNDPIDIDTARIRMTLNTPEVIAYMKRLPNADLQWLDAFATAAPLATWTSVGADGYEINTDLFPRDEMFLHNQRSP